MSIIESNRDDIERHLWETFLIDAYTEFRKQIQEASNDKRENHNQHLILNKFFLLRYNRDPGFYAHVCKIVSKDKKVQEKTIEKIKELFSEYVHPIDEELFDFKPEKSEINEMLSDNSIKSPESITDESMVTLVFPGRVHEKEIEYFKKRYDEAVNRGDDDKAFAIRVLLAGSLTGMYFDHHLFMETSLYKNIIPPNKWTYSIEKYIVENIKFDEIYNIKPNEIELPAISYSNWKFTKSLMSLLDENGDCYTLGKYNFKFINDSIDIASFLWFHHKKSISEKLKILNEQYPYKIDSEMLDSYLENKKDRLNHLFINAIEILKDYDFHNANMVFSYILDKCSDSNLKISCLINLAIIFHEQEEDNKALEYCIRACKLFSTLNNSPGFNPTYEKSIELIILGKIFSQLGEVERSEKCFSKAQDSINRFSTTEKLVILRELASGYRLMHNFEKEYDILNCFDEISMPDMDNTVIERLRELNENMLPNGAFDSIELKLIDEYKKSMYDIEKSKFCYLKGISMLHSFQFDKALDYFEKTNNSDKINALSYIASCYLHKGDLLNAKNSYHTILEYRNTDIEAYILLASIYIHENNFDIGIKNLEKALEISSKIGGENIYVNVLKVCIKWLIIFKDEMKIIYKIFDHLETKLSTLEEGLSPCFEIGNTFSELGFYNDALNYFDLGLSKESNPKNKAKLLNNKGAILMKQIKNDDALSMFKESIELWEENRGAWYNMAAIYIDKLDLLKADECIKMAIKYYPDDLESIQLRDVIKTFSDDVINYKSIKDDEIKHDIESAEKLLIKGPINNNINQILRMPFIGYDDALKKMLHIYISSKIEDIIFQQFERPIESKYWNGDNDNIDPLPYALKKLLNFNKPVMISPGEWKGLIDELNDNKVKNPIFQMFKENIKYTEKDMKLIKFACAEISEHRNNATHENKIFTRKKALEVRKKIIPHLNNVINIIYG